MGWRKKLPASPMFPRGSGQRIGTASARPRATKITASEPAVTSLNRVLPRNSANSIFIAVLDNTPTAMAVAAIVGDAACATSFAIEIVSASTSVSPSTAAEVRIPDAPSAPVRCGRR